jgi:alkanesulfonate monooxygenase SsuD/methylene tetrahydromethanopterin reductase-like flavin-dependent oxidoreductase (luciferase family)
MDRILQEQRAIIGSPGSVERQIRDTLARFGDVEPSLQTLYGAMPYEVAECSLRLFAAEVMPRFGASAPTPRS